MVTGVLTFLMWSTQKQIGELNSEFRKVGIIDSRELEITKMRLIQ
jgi:hypothetical protein